MYIYYILINNKLNYFESEEKQTKKDFEEYFKNFDEKIEVFQNCCNYGPFDLIYKNY